MGDLNICSLVEMNLQDFIMGLNSSLTKATIKKRFKKYYKTSQKIGIKEIIHLPIDLLNYGKINPNFNLEKQIEIIFENDLWIAINKPYSIHSHPLDYSCRLNALSFLCSQGKYSALQVNKKNYDRGLLFRLDRDTSGVLIFAKTNQLYQEVRKQFSVIAKKKVYLAKVSSDARQLIGEHRHYMKASGKQGSKMISSLASDSESFLAVLDIIKVNYDAISNTSIVKVALKTGIRHQIRFQLHELGFAILGDSLYGGAKASRMFLHALEYKIKTVDSEVCLNTGYPEDF